MAVRPKWLLKNWVFPNTIITLLIGTLLSVIERGDYLENYALSAIYTFSISSIAHAVSHYFKHKLERYTPLYRTIGYLSIFFISGCLGTILGSAIAAFSLKSESLDFLKLTLYLIVFNVFITLVVGTATSIYERIRSQQEKTQLVLKEKEIAQRELENLRAQAELKALQAQINPHFLFNTLNSIASLIPENPKLAESVVEELSDYFRKTLNLSEKITIKLKEEIDLVRNYLEIEKIRFGERLIYNLDISSKYYDIEIPALIIQPLIENSIKYAVTNNSGETNISLKVYNHNRILNIEVCDDGPGLANDWDNRGFGLKNVNSRLKYFYGDNARLQVISKNGTKNLIRIPFV